MLTTVKTKLNSLRFKCCNGVLPLELEFVLGPKERLDFCRLGGVSEVRTFPHRLGPFGVASDEMFDDKLFEREPDDLGGLALIESPDK